MSSSVHFKFKSQKEPSRVVFDGTGISVFELKREIISQNRLGDGTDFELSVYNEDTGEEYDDDTSIIPRSTSVIARRLPASRPGKGGAARYVSGKTPITARNPSRPEASSSNRGMNVPSQLAQNGVSELNDAQTEEEKIKALFSLQANQWKEQQEEMANATPVAFGRGRGKPVSVPDHPPPPGYLCYRCREKGHWIQACPTNNDPKFDGRYRVKRSTGIPRSLQTKIEKSAALAVDGQTEELKNSGVMVNADGDFVIANPDKASWEIYQEKVKASAAAAAEAAAAEGSKQLQARGLECPIDKRMFLEPTKTPCCGRTYCNECITNALIESDFICPGCSTEGVLLDNLSVDEKAVAKIKEYELEKAEEKKEKEKQSQSQVTPQTNKTEIGGDASKSTDKPVNATAQNGHSTGDANRKRAVDLRPDEDASQKPPVESHSKRRKPEEIPQQKETPLTQGSSSSIQLPGLATNSFNSSVPFGDVNLGQNQGMPMANFSQGVMSAGMGYPNPTMFGGTSFPGPMNGWNGMNTMEMAAQSTGMYDPNMVTMMSNNPYGYNMYSSGVNPMAQYPPFQQQAQGSFQQGPVRNNTFLNQQRNAFTAPSGREEDNAYFRQPVNPHRHQARQRRIRPSDYREL